MSDVATLEERQELARIATVQIQGLADALLDIVRSQRVDSQAPLHHAALGMLAQIRDLSDDVFILAHADEEVMRGEVSDLMRKMGLESL